MKKVILVTMLALSLCACKDSETIEAKGSDGAQGIQGVSGEAGAQGERGESGEAGSNGLNGKDGSNGVDGVDGRDGKDGLNGSNGRDGVDGKDGADGKDGNQNLVVLQYRIPTKGKCVAIRHGIYIENEGGHIDIYDNADCDHYTGKAYCNDVDHDDNDVCTVRSGTDLFEYTVEGKYTDIIVTEKQFIDVPKAILLD